MISVIIASMGIKQSTSGGNLESSTRAAGLNSDERSPLQIRPESNVGFLSVSQSQARENGIPLASNYVPAEAKYVRTPTESQVARQVWVREHFLQTVH